ncbi:hypothetical protein N9C07_05585 [Flavobacteriaceae bacterium]|nr:hypothetical protein [Flavobacteriaceae bacterium]MDC1542169.1 hypothetical protein [Flavobacteriaceae bacterium]
MKQMHSGLFLLSISFVTFLILIIPFIELTFGLVCCFFSYLLFGFFSQFKSKNNFNWFNILSIKLILTVLVAVIFVQYPLIQGDTLRSSFQDMRLQDSNYFDFIAIELVSKGLNKDTFHLLFSTWSSFGIILYLYFTYYIFGTNYLAIVIVNSALSVVGISYLYRLLNPLNVKKFKYMLYGICLPLFVYYDSTASKETLTFLFISASLFYNYQFKFSKNFLGLGISILGLLIMRPNVGLLMIIFFMITKDRILSIKSIFSIIFLSVPLYFIVDKILGIKIILDAYFSIDNLLKIKSLANDLVINSPLKSKIIELFDGTTIPKLILFAPLRLIVWLFLPFPLLYFDFYELYGNVSDIENNWLLFYHNSYSLIRSFNALFIIYFIYRIFRMTFKSKWSSLGSEQKYIFQFIIYLGIIITSFSFANSSRYRILLEPFIFSLFISLKYSKHTSNN